MSFLSFLLIASLLINIGDTIECPSSYLFILNGCYKMMNGSNMTWSTARQYCTNEKNNIVTNRTDFVTHLLALESAFETNALLYWMKTWAIQSNFWTDGVVSSSTWNWSNQSIVWYFDSNSQEIDGIGSYYQLIYNIKENAYKINDSPDNALSNFICEYQEPCDTNNTCQNDAQCYLNVGRELCLCAPRYTGAVCDQRIDECLSSPCQHGGICINQLNNYTCNCSNLLFTGPNCEIQIDEPTQSQGSTAFSSVFSVVCNLVFLLILFNLP